HQDTRLAQHYELLSTTVSLGDVSHHHRASARIPPLVQQIGKSAAHFRARAISHRYTPSRYASHSGNALAPHPPSCRPARQFPYTTNLVQLATRTPRAASVTDASLPPSPDFPPRPRPSCRARRTRSRRLLPAPPHDSAASF